MYKTERRGALLTIRSFVEGPEGKAYPKLLLDTGSVYTMISQEVLESIGCSPAVPVRKQRIITGSGYEIVPVVTVKRFHCLGNAIADFEILAHSLPYGAYVDGLLGMDYLTKFDVEIRLMSGEIIIK